MLTFFTTNMFLVMIEMTHNFQNFWTTIQMFLFIDNNRFVEIFLTNVMAVVKEFLSFFFRKISYATKQIQVLSFRQKQTN